MDTPQIVFEDLGRIGYQEAWDLQRQRHAQVLADEQPMTVFMLEHDPVITIGRHPGAAAHLLATPELLQRQGVEVCETDRGGDITYHGPGQLVVYPILHLNRLNQGVRGYVRLLEQVVIDLLEIYGINAERDSEAVGVWVNRAGQGGRPEDRMVHLAKIAAIGVRVRQRATLHGLALNINPNMAHFQLIVPCGLAGRPLTSMAQLLPEGCPTLPQVKQRIPDLFRRRLSEIGEG